MWHTGQDPPISSKDIIMVHNTTGGPLTLVGYYSLESSDWRVQGMDCDAPDYWCYSPDRYTQVSQPEEDKLVREIYSVLQSISDQSQDVRQFIERLKTQNTRHKDDENGTNRPHR